MEEVEVRRLFQRHYEGDVERVVEMDDTSGTMGKQYLVEGGGRGWLLSIADDLYPRVKTENHVACLRFVKERTGIPVPKVAFWGVEEGREYICTERMSGEALSQIWEQLDEEQVEAVIEQVAGVYKELSALKGNSPTGLRIEGCEVVPGPRLSYSVYSNRHIARHWSEYPEESFHTLNVCEVLDDEVQFILAGLKRDVHVIETHRACMGLREGFLSRLVQLVEHMEVNQLAIECRPLHFAHRDLHLGNMLFDKETNQITAVLDWELAGFFSDDDWEPGNTLAPVRDPTGVGERLLPQWRNDCLKKLSPCLHPILTSRDSGRSKASPFGSHSQR
ncbi:hypothetical protein TRICI_001952 [Trichomonascus ciferrii]|uniref:Aminoglycoside phosphotransferase domain-containing protein n=1 Tax=Trichomonascus ciferrii TaxID=44093 RepID=A0A642V7Y6_9ASCO|nr:hypothetical protein TRICI_001952 [Trichomonascus ciferrii]